MKYAFDVQVEDSAECIQVPSRSVKELVEFYYVWKKSKRYEDFIIQHGKMGKKKVTLQPGQV